MSSTGKISLLIVEDDPNIRFLLETAAVRAGTFEPVFTAIDGQDALDRLKQASVGTLPTFIVTDLAMPRVTGLELVRALKADPVLRAIPIAMITSSNVPNDREDALAAGACAFIAKPQGLEALKNALLDLRRSLVDVTQPQHHAA